jgi:molecular chaperone GrpE
MMAEDKKKNEQNLEDQPVEDNSPTEEQEETTDGIEEVEPELTELPDDIQRLKLELDEYKNLYLRKAAEFENFKKRKQQEFKALIQSAEESLIASLLPVLDDFERVQANHNADVESLLQGVQLIRDKFWDALAARGLQIVESVGKPFDPRLHEAILQQEEDGTEPDIVLQEHERGYQLGEKVIRHSKVVVSA